MRDPRLFILLSVRSSLDPNLISLSIFGVRTGLIPFLYEADFMRRKEREYFCDFCDRRPGSVRFISNSFYGYWIRSGKISRTRYSVLGGITLLIYGVKNWTTKIIFNVKQKVFGKYRIQVRRKLILIRRNSSLVSGLSYHWSLLVSGLKYHWLLPLILGLTYHWLLLLTFSVQGTSCLNQKKN